MIKNKYLKKKYENISLISINKIANYKYIIYDKFEAGLALYGWEVKELRNGKCDLHNNYIFIKGHEAYLSNVIINNKFSLENQQNSMRIRKLLLKQHELNYIYGKIHNNTYTAIALSIYWKNNLCKAKIAIAKGKKKYDKRNVIEKKEWLTYKNMINKHKN